MNMKTRFLQLYSNITSFSPKERCMKTFTALFLFCLSIQLNAQSTYTGHLRTSQAGKGTVVIIQSDAIEQAVNNHQQPVTPSAKAGPKQDAKQHPTSTPKASDAKHSGNHAEQSAEAHAASAGSSRHYAERTRHKARGFRICIFTGGNSRADKAKALEMGRKCRAKFPELAVYSNFVAPRWVTNVGDFRTRQEAHKYVKLIRKAHFTYEVRVVSSEVNLPNY